jgi:hypothetical protein
MRPATQMHRACSQPKRSRGGQRPFRVRGTTQTDQIEHDLGPIYIGPGDALRSWFQIILFG